MTFRQGFAALAAFVFLEGLYAVALQSWFYRHAGPYYDSIVYYNFLAETWSRARTDGVWPALRAGWMYGTLALPWLEIAPIARLVPLTRQLGIWLQAVWLLALGMSIYDYLARRRGLAPVHAFCCTLPFLAFRTVFEWNGGLPDFRMDLSLYLFTSLAALWYLTTYETRAWTPWLLSGCFAALACLARGTAPVYLAVMLGPPILVRLLLARGDRLDLPARLVCMALPVAAVAAPYLAVNLPTLYSYYMVTKGDANAGLPIRESIRHFTFVRWSLGPLLQLLLGIGWLLLIADGWKERGRSWKAALASLDWKIAWIAFAPAAFLAWHGAGPNPFVAMPSVFGLLLFLLMPFRGAVPFRPGTRRAVAAMATVAVLGTAAAGVLFHRAGLKYTASMPAIRQAIEEIRADAKQRGAKRVSVVSPYVGTLLPFAMTHTLLFDEHATRRPAGVVDYNGLLFTEGEIGRFWSALSIPDDKIGPIAGAAHQFVDYFLLPDEATFAGLVGQPHGPANRKMWVLKRALLGTGQWERFGPRLAIRSGEVVEMYRRQRRAGE